MSLTVGNIVLIFVTEASVSINDVSCKFCDVANRLIERGVCGLGRETGDISCDKKNKKIN